MENQFTQLLALDDVNLPHSLRRSIWLIRDEEDSNNYTADEILDDKSQDIIFNMRSTLTGAYKSGDPKYVCPFCGEPIGLKVRTFEGDFSHSSHITKIVMTLVHLKQQMMLIPRE